MNWRKLQNNLDPRNLDKDELLKFVGLETRREPTDWILPTLTAFSVGLLVGAGVGLLLAPKSGNELRADLRNRLQPGSDDASRSLSSVPATGAETPRPV